MYNINNKDQNQYIDRGNPNMQPPAQGAQPQAGQPPQSPWRQVPPAPYRPYGQAGAANPTGPAAPGAVPPVPQSSTPNAPQGTGTNSYGIADHSVPGPGANPQNSTPNANAAPAPENTSPTPAQPPQNTAQVPPVEANPGSVPGQPVLRIEAPFTGPASGYHTNNPSGSAGHSANASQPGFEQAPAAGDALGGSGSGGPGGGKDDNRRKGRGKGFIAAMLALSLLTGSAGGGATYFALQQFSGSQVTEVSAGETNAGPTNVTNLQASDITRVVDKAAASVVEISCEVRMSGFFTGYSSESSGSGVIVSDDGYIVTNDHVIEGASAITVRLSDGEEYTATLIGTDSKTDIAVLKIDAGGLAAAEFANSDQIVVGQLAIAIGNPLGTLGGTVTEGIISGLDREITIGNETMTLIQTSAAVNPGNSGGGLFDADGRLVGVVNSKSYGVEVEGLGFAIPANTVAEVVEDLLESGYVTGRPQLGIQIVDITDQQTMVYYGVSEPGVYVDQVNRDIALEPGDRIVQVNGEAIESGSQLKNMVSECNVGDIMEFIVVRDGKRLSVQVELAEQVPDYAQQAVSAEA